MTRTISDALRCVDFDLSWWIMHVVERDQGHVRNDGAEAIREMIECARQGDPDAFGR